MANSGIITGQYVRIRQTPASIGDRILAQIIDWIIIACYITAMNWTGSISGLSVFNITWFYFLTVLLPVLCYCPLCEMLNSGQTVGKWLLKTRVVKTDGSQPGIGAYLLRWLLFIVDGPMLSGAGLLVMMLNDRRQRLGDLAAGTMVIKLQNYHRMKVSLSEYSYLSNNYRPTYPQASDLSLEQAELINETAQLADDDPRIHALAAKVKQTLGIEARANHNDSLFLYIIARDYRYYALEEI